MILEAVAAVVGTFVLFVTQGLPVGTLELPSFAPIVQLARTMDPILPVTEAVEMAILSVQSTVIIFGFMLLIWVYRLIPFKGT